MTIGAVTAAEDIIRDKDNPKPSKWFSGWMQSAFAALFGWSRSFTGSASLDFPNIAAGSQQKLTMTVKGARLGDAVKVTPQTQVDGLGVDGIVTANDTVTVVRFNYTAAGIDPAADTFRTVVWQQ